MQNYHRKCCPFLLMTSLWLVVAAAVMAVPAPSNSESAGSQQQQASLHQDINQQQASSPHQDHHEHPLDEGDIRRNLLSKRSWNQMQGVWGKRAADDEDVDEDDEMQMASKRAWKDLTSQGWGKRSWDQLKGVWGKRSGGALAAADEEDDNENEENNAALKRSTGWNKLQGVWGKRSSMMDEDEQQADQAAAAGFDDVNKRAWNQMQGAWGKRSVQDGAELDENVTAKQRLAAAMAAASLVPKRGGWSNLRGAWGKREMPAGLLFSGIAPSHSLLKSNEWSRKRESGWNNLKGLWG